jgi:hypothetical protein
MIIDSRIGGMGDVWMRLLALYTLSRFVPETITLIVKPPLAQISESLFGDRIQIRTQGVSDVVFTHYGLRHLAGGILRGIKYIHPFHWVLRETRRHYSLQSSLNDVAINLASRFGVLLLPARERVWEYQGFMELSALESFTQVPISEFETASKEDLPYISSKLKKQISPSGCSEHEILVFPSGTAHQIMPPSFARNYLSTASFAFHRSDNFAREYENEGLRIKTFSSPEEMLALGCNAQWVICTDSFPSHLWQTWMDGVLIVLSQQTAKQIVHPGFSKSQIIDSRAACVKCRSRVRTRLDDVCDSGHIFCETWTNPEYIQSFRNAIGR